MELVESVQFDGGGSGAGVSGLGLGLGLGGGLGGSSSPVSVVPPTPFAVGSKVEGNYGGDGEWYVGLHTLDLPTYQTHISWIIQNMGPGPRAGHSWFDHATPTPPLLPLFSIPPILTISPLRAEHPLERVTRKFYLRPEDLTPTRHINKIYIKILIYIPESLLLSRCTPTRQLHHPRRSRHQSGRTHGAEDDLLQRLQPNRGRTRVLRADRFRHYG